MVTVMGALGAGSRPVGGEGGNSDRAQGRPVWCTNARGA